MRIKTIEKMKFRLTGRSVPAVKVADIAEDGRVTTLQLLGEVKDRPNSLVNTWDEKGWEKDSKASMITVIGENGIKNLSHVVSETGKTVNIYITKRESPNLEDVIGHAATMDDIADSMDLGKSYRNILIGILIGAPLWWIIFQVLGAMMK